MMAEDLFRGKCMHGDMALCESHHSAESFYNLVRLGVPFPHDRYGGYVGFKTDNDPLGRGVSAGPLTSRFICKSIGSAICEKDITILDDHETVALLFDRDDEGVKQVCGAVAIHKGGRGGNTFGFVLFNVRNIILATGGPGQMYQASAYPDTQIGSTGMALAIGATAQNLTESQFGIASIGFRWNLSGSYQQVIPRYVSTNKDGGDEKEFLDNYFPDMKALTSAIFRKGYEWPFDVDKLKGCGSSLIDLAVYRETAQRGRKVFLDYSQNPASRCGIGNLFFDLLDPEAIDYLNKSNALKPTPVERLKAMNPQAFELFISQGIDLEKDLLEVAVCAQHCNGGLKTNIWWESNVRHLFPVGEVCGTHGVRRPGGAALNSGQVGSLRAAKFIATKYNEPPNHVNEFILRVRGQVSALLEFAGSAVEDTSEKDLTPTQVNLDIQERMSAAGAHIRQPSTVSRALGEAWELYKDIMSKLRVSSIENLHRAFRAKDLALTHAIWLEALDEYIRQGGMSRGSAVILDPNGELPCEELKKEWKFSITPDDAFVNNKILEVKLDSNCGVKRRWVDIRPIPYDDSWFENIWNDFVDGKIICREDS